MNIKHKIIKLVKIMVNEALKLVGSSHYLVSLSNPKDTARISGDGLAQIHSLVYSLRAPVASLFNFL
jgi:hypothetical protein